MAHTPFRVQNPRPFPANDGALPASVATQNSELIRIVVADGHPGFCTGLCHLLTLEKDFRIVARAGDGKDVPEAIEQFQPDILLLDLYIPGSDGLTVLKKLWKPTMKTKIIVLA